jgi:hypothetical protein
VRSHAVPAAARGPAARGAWSRARRPRTPGCGRSATT